MYILTIISESYLYLIPVILLWASTLLIVTELSKSLPILEINLVVCGFEEKLWSDYTVTSYASGKTYRVALRGWVERVT